MAYAQTKGIRRPDINVTVNVEVKRDMSWRQELRRATELGLGLTGPDRA